MTELIKKLRDGSIARCKPDEVFDETWIQLLRLKGDRLPVAVTLHDDGTVDTYVPAVQLLYTLSVGPIEYDPDIPDRVAEQFEWAKSNPREVRDD